MPLPALLPEYKILKNCYEHEADSSLKNVIDFQRQNSKGESENVKVRVVYIGYPDQRSVVQYNDGSEWKAFDDADSRKLSLEDVIAENKKRDLAYATALKKTLEEGEKVSGFDLASLFKRAFEEGYIEASKVIFDKFLAQTQDKFDAAALRKFYNIINPPDNLHGYNSSSETYENTSGQPVVDLAQRQALKDLVTAHVKTRNSEHRRNIVTSSVPIDAIKMSLETSLGPRRYQAILGILKFDCGIPPEDLGGLDEYAGNADKFKKIQFDHEDSHKAVGEKEAKEFTEFNQNSLALLDQQDGKLWETLDHFLRNEAYKKDLSRIVEKLKPSEDLREKIERHLLAIYSGGAIEEPFNQLKIILISKRLEAKGLALDKAIDLATRSVIRRESLQNLQQDESVQKMGERKPTDKKFEAIFTKYAAFGKISDATQLRKRVVGKILSQFQKKFAEQIRHLDGIQTVEMDGSEILFRGLDQRSGLTEELIREEFEDIHVGMSTSDGVSQQLSSYKIQQKRVFGPEGLSRRASYAAATTFNFAVAAKYAGNEGWIYDIRPKKGKLATNMQKLAPKYQEIDFEAIDPEEIYAVYKISQTSGDTADTTTRANTIEKVILNPHYKKRGDDPLGLLTEGQKIATEETESNCGGNSFSVKSGVNVAGNVDVFKEFNEKQLELHKSKYSLGSHLREATSALMQNREPALPLPTLSNYNKSFANVDPLSLESRLESETFRKEVRTMTLERARYFWANDLRRSAIVTTHHADILTAKTEAIVNAGNAVLDLGNYRVSGLSKAVHDEFGYAEPTFHLDNKTGRHFKNKESNLVRALLKGDAKTEDCTAFVDAFDSKGEAILEKEQAKNDEGKKLFWDSKAKKLTTEETAIPYREQEQITVPAKKLKTGEVAIAEIDSDLDSKSKSKIGSKNGVKFIIHAVGPDCRRNEFKVLENDAKEAADGKIAARKEALKNTYKTLLEKALEKNVKKIAVPVLSIGVFEYPEEEAAQVIGEVLRDFGSKFEEISIFAMDPKNKGNRPAILDLIEQNLFQRNFDLMQEGNKPKANDEKAWKKNSKDENDADFAVALKPSGSVKASLFSPLMKQNKNNVWYVAEDPDESLNSDARANKFKVIDGIYGKEKSETSELKNTFIDILINLAAGSEDGPKRQKLERAQVLAIIAKAKERGGIKNKANERGGYFKPATEIEDISNIPAVEAKKFSAAFQKECEACGIYSGRKGGKSVGLRLTFIPDDVVEKFTKLSTEEYAALASSSDSNLTKRKTLAVTISTAK